MRADGQVPGTWSALRKLLHLAMAALPAIGWRWSYRWELALVGLFLAASLGVEVARRAWPEVNRLLWRLLPSVFREGEGRQVLGSTWFAVGAAATLLLFGRDTGGTALLFLIWGDAMAEVVGRRWGRGGQGKTVAGSLACLAACLVAAGVGVGLGGLHPGAALLGAAMATLVERRPPPPNDNVWMPLLSGLAMGGAAGLWGR